MKRVKKRVKKKVIKAPKIQTIFCIISVVFILGCCGFYGNRLIKYYKIYNPKSDSGETLVNFASSIINSNSIVYEDDGLYSSGGGYVYKGNNVNNYVLVSNMLFRIIKINNDKTIDLVLDDYLNKLSFNEELVNFDKSSLSKYLNDKFLSALNQDLLVKTTICSDTIPELSEVKCDTTTDNNYVRVLGISEFLNSKNDDKTYIIKNNEYLWLYNHGNNNVWHTSGVSLANNKSINEYAIKPVITLKNSCVLVSGEGSINNPYRIEENKKEINVGTYLDINDETYIVYEIGDNHLKVEANKVLKDIIFDKTTNDFNNSSLKTYLEDKYLKKLNIDDLLIDVNFNDNVKGKVGLLTKNDFKFNDTLKNYYLLDNADKEVVLYNGSIKTSKIHVKRNIRPCLGIKKDLKIISGNGSKLAPFIVEV